MIHIALSSLKEGHDNTRGQMYWPTCRRGCKNPQENENWRERIGVKELLVLSFSNGI